MQISMTHILHTLEEFDADPHFLLYNFSIMETLSMIHSSAQLYSLYLDKWPLFNLLHVEIKICMQKKASKLTNWKKASNRVFFVFS
jgi:hypothetical protein